MRYKNNIGPQVRLRRCSVGWSQPDFATKLQLAGLDISRSGVSKIEARLSYVDDKTLLYLAEVLKVQVQELFPPRTRGNRIHDFMEKLETRRGFDVLRCLRRARRAGTCFCSCRGEAASDAKKRSAVLRATQQVLLHEKLQPAYEDYFWRDAARFLNVRNRLDDTIKHVSPAVRERLLRFCEFHSAE